MNPAPPAVQPVASDKLSLAQKIIFTFGNNLDYVSITVLTNVLWIPFFNLGYGISPTRLGVILMIVRLWDVVTNPILGAWADNIRTRWGRRKPLMLIGCVGTALLFPLFWYLPAAWSEQSHVTYLLILGLIYFTIHTVWSLAYYSLHLELTSDYDERTSISAWMTFFNKFAYLGGGWILAFATGSRFINPATGKGDIIVGMHTLCWYLAALILIFGLVPTFFTKERAISIEGLKQPKTTIWQSVSESARCIPLWFLIGLNLFLVVGYASVGSLANYVYIYHLFDGNAAAGNVLFGWKTTVTMLAGLASLPLLTWLSARYEKKSMVTAMLLICIVGHLLNYVFLDPHHPYYMLIPAVLESCGIAAIGLFLPSMKGDVADYFEYDRHARKEGSINALFATFHKIAGTLSVGLSGLVIDLSGFSAKLTHQPPAVLKNMISMYVLLPIGVWIIALFINHYYPLTRTRMSEIRNELEARRRVL